MSFHPTLTVTCACPQCFEENEWKRPKLIVLEGTTAVDTTSIGGGLGMEIGIGRGQGGSSVRYQGVTLRTTGTQTSSMATAYFPPDEPIEYSKLDYWIKIASDAVTHSAVLVRNLEQSCAEGKTPGFFTNPDAEIKAAEKNYLDARSTIDRLAKYETDLGIWEHSRVCSRCGTAYITQSDYASIAHKIQVPSPEFDFPGRGSKCTCGSYIWISALKNLSHQIEKAYEPYTSLSSKIQQLESHLVEARKHHSQAEMEVKERAGDGSIFHRLRKKISPPDPIARLNEMLALEASLTQSKAQQISVLMRTEADVAKLNEQKTNDPYFLHRRFCSKCHQGYIPQ